MLARRRVASRLVAGQHCLVGASISTPRAWLPAAEPPRHAELASYPHADEFVLVYGERDDVEAPREAVAPVMLLLGLRLSEPKTQVARKRRARLPQLSACSGNAAPGRSRAS